MIPSSFWLLVIVVAVCRISCVGSASANNINAHLIRAPSVFPPESCDMHRYSAILAATEPFRRLCNDQIKRSLNPMTRIVKTLMGKSLLQQGVEERRTNMPVDVALTRFEMRVQSIAGWVDQLHY